MRSSRCKHLVVRCPNTGRKPAACSFARIAASTLSIFIRACLIAFAGIGLTIAITTVAVKGASSRTTAAVFPVACSTTSSFPISCLKRLEVMPSSRPARNSEGRPFPSISCFALSIGVRGAHSLVGDSTEYPIATYIGRFKGQSGNNRALSCHIPGECIRLFTEELRLVPMPILERVDGCSAFQSTDCGSWPL